MTLDEKLYQRMVQLGLTQQALSLRAGVSDSEVSRLLNGQSKRPGLHNILRLARALNVSVDYLADDALEDDPLVPDEPIGDDERQVVERSRALGFRDVLMILDAVRILGYDVAIRRLYGLDVRSDREAVDGDVAIPHPLDAGHARPV